jgi:hypothetical protein
VATACCAELAACDTGTDCGTLLDCLQAATDMAAQMKCQTDNSAGVPDAQALVGCAKSCDGTSCSNGICTTGLTSNKPACDTCLTTNCCTEFDGCVADAACKACLLNPAGAGCDMNVMAKAAATCESTKCKTECM